MKRTLLACGLGLIALAIMPPSTLEAQAIDRQTFLYEQPVGGVYTQGWYGQELGERREGVFGVYVTGEGKLGDFHGIISVDCYNPARSEWLATGGFLSSARVPSEVINTIRNLVCDVRRP